MENNKGKLFGKINVVDLLVVLIVIVAVAVTIFKFNFSAHSDVTSSNAKAQYTILTKQVRMFTVDQLVVGDKIFDEESGKCVGEITDVSFEPAFDYVIKTDGTPVYSQIPEKYDVKVTIETDCVVNDSGINANGKFLYYNQKNIYYTKRVQIESQMVELDIVE